MKSEETKNKEQLLEIVAEQIHNHWVIWAKELLASEPNISENRKQRWEKECFVEYAQLSEEMKDLDGKFANDILNISSGIED